VLLRVPEPTDEAGATPSAYALPLVGCLINSLMLRVTLLISIHPNPKQEIEMSNPTAAQLVELFRSLTIQEQRRFFTAVSTDEALPYVVRKVASQAAEELIDYCEFHSQPA
jgi:hypothetical protein